MARAGYWGGKKRRREMGSLRRGEWGNGLITGEDEEFPVYASEGTGIGAGSNGP